MNIEIANRLVELRKANGYSQEALAAKLGLSRQAISKWERAEASPDTANLMALASLYGITMDALLNGTQTPAAEDAQAQAKEKAAPPKTELQKKGIKLLKFPFPIILAIVYVLLGVAFHLWAQAWVLFLLLPIYYHLAAALTIRKKKARLLAMPAPEILISLYLLFGFFFHMWSTMWVLLLFIPLYYWLAAYLCKEKSADSDTQTK